MKINYKRFNNKQMDFLFNKINIMNRMQLLEQLWQLHNKVN